MTAADYPVEFAYGAQDGKYYGPNGIVGLYHKGNDRYTPAWTPVVIVGTIIGYTGASGVVSGPHLHTQAWVGSPTTGDRNPNPYEFKPGRVVAVGDGGQWGKYITVDVNGVNLTYAHLARTSVTVGQVIGDVDMEEIQKLYKSLNSTNERLDKIAKDLEELYNIVNRAQQDIDSVRQKLEQVQGGSVDGNYSIKKIV